VDPSRTRPADADWSPEAPGWRVHGETVPVGRGEQAWADAAAVLEWAVKTRSGFAVRPPGPVREGTDLELVAAVGPLRITEPVLLVAQRVYRRRYRRALVTAPRSGGARRRGR